jgi:lambda family phage portal protein
MLKFFERLFGKPKPAAGNYAPNYRLYAGAKGGRLNADWITSGTSADAEINSSLPRLQARSRQLCRDNDYAKCAIRVIKSNVIGTKINFQSQLEVKKGVRDDEINSRIENLWKYWSNPKYCHTGGKLSLGDIQHLALGEVVKAGEVFLRLVKKSFGGCSIPLAIEFIEAERVDRNYNGRSHEGNEIRMGIEVDIWLRPVAYWVFESHPGDYQFSRNSQKRIRIPSDEIFHLYVADDPNQTRGVPWFHTALQRLRNLGGYEEAELVAARASASIMGFLQTDHPDVLDAEEDNGQSVESLEAGTIKKLYAGETFTGFNPSRPNTGLDPFLRIMLRGVAAGIGMSYESLSKDWSQSNYSSSRLSLLEDKDGWKILQEWMLTHFLQPLYEIWIEMAVLSGALSLPDFELRREKYLAPRWTPRGWSWVDPAKEIRATIDAIDAGLTTLTQEIAKQGGDIEETLKARANELNLAKSLGIDLYVNKKPVGGFDFVDLAGGNNGKKYNFTAQ